MSEEIDNLIEEGYEETNFGGIEPIFKYLQKNHKEAEITRSDIKKYLDKQQQEQLLKQQRPPKALGHIVASYPGEVIQIDIYDLSRYEPYNKPNKKKDGYKYIFAAVDVFTRYAVAVPMVSKNIDDTTDALNFVIHNFMKPVIIMSDNDSSFTGHQFQELLDKQDIILNTNVKGDHFALGIIDNFAKRLKLIFAKKFLKYKTKNWVQYLTEVIDSYNDSPHSALDGLSPLEALEKKNFTKIFEINSVKGLKNKTVSDLEVGDKVRVRIAGMFTKSSEPQYSDKVYTVETVKGSTIYLSDGEVKKRYDLLKVPNDTITNDKNVIIQAKEKSKAKKANIKAGVSKKNIIREPRQVEVINNEPVEVRRSSRANKGVNHRYD
jgi:hypothetical protein